MFSGHDIVQSESITLLNCLVKFGSLFSLHSLPHEDMFPEREARLAAKTYSELVHYLVHTMSDRFFVFYDREATLDALRIALPRDRTIDLGRQILLRNDELRAGGKIWIRSRGRLAPLQGLWEPLLRTHFPDDLAARGRGMISLFRMFAQVL